MLMWEVKLGVTEKVEFGYKYELKIKVLIGTIGLSGFRRKKERVSPSNQFLQAKGFQWRTSWENQVCTFAETWVWMSREFHISSKFGLFRMKSFFFTQSWRWRDFQLDLLLKVQSFICVLVGKIENARFWEVCVRKLKRVLSKSVFWYSGLPYVRCQEPTVSTFNRIFF